MRYFTKDAKIMRKDEAIKILQDMRKILEEPHPEYRSPLDNDRIKALNLAIIALVAKYED